MQRRNHDILQKSFTLSRNFAYGTRDNRQKTRVNGQKNSCKLPQDTRKIVKKHELFRYNGSNLLPCRCNNEWMG
jgi:hypothetical protein